MTASCTDTCTIAIARVCCTGESADAGRCQSRPAFTRRYEVKRKHSLSFAVVFLLAALPAIPLGAAVEGMESGVEQIPQDEGSE